MTTQDEYSEMEKAKAERIAEANRIAEEKAKAEERKNQPIPLPEAELTARLAKAEADYKKAEAEVVRLQSQKMRDEKELAEAKKDSAKKAKANNLLQSTQALNEAEAEKARLFAIAEFYTAEANKKAEIKPPQADNANAKTDYVHLPSEPTQVKPIDFSLILEATGIKNHNEKYNASAMILTCNQDYIDKNGAMVDRHVILDCGSLFDSLTTVKIKYSKADTEAWITLAYFANADSQRFEILSGLNEDKAEIKSQTLVYPSGKKEGKPIFAEAKVNSMRFQLAKIVPYCLPYLSAKFQSETASKLDTLQDTLGKLEDRLEKVIEKIAENTISSKPTNKFEDTAKELTEKIKKVKAEITAELSGKDTAEDSEAKAKKAEEKARIKAEIAKKYAEMLAKI